MEDKGAVLGKRQGMIDRLRPALADHLAAEVDALLVGVKAEATGQAAEVGQGQARLEGVLATLPDRAGDHDRLLDVERLAGEDLDPVIGVQRCIVGPGKKLGQGEPLHRGAGCGAIIAMEQTEIQDGVGFEHAPVHQDFRQLQPRLIGVLVGEPDVAGKVDHFWAPDALGQLNRFAKFALGEDLDPIIGVQHSVILTGKQTGQGELLDLVLGGLLIITVQQAELEHGLGLEELWRGHDLGQLDPGPVIVDIREPDIALDADGLRPGRAQVLELEQVAVADRDGGQIIGAGALVDILDDEILIFAVTPEVHAIDVGLRQGSTGDVQEIGHVIFRGQFIDPGLGNGPGHCGRGTNSGHEQHIAVAERHIAAA